MIHYEKLCSLQPHCPTTKAPKQVIYNYIATIPWKYEKLVKNAQVEKSRSYVVVAN
jgi:hypothetical protein